MSNNFYRDLKLALNWWEDTSVINQIIYAEQHYPDHTYLNVKNSVYKIYAIWNVEVGF